jgi:flagellar biosynthesis/type III secretory pathway chaperone
LRRRGAEQQLARLAEAKRYLMDQLSRGRATRCQAKSELKEIIQTRALLMPSLWNGIRLKVGV